MFLRSALRYWLPPILWAGFIFAASTNAFSSVHTAPWMARILMAIFGHSLPQSQFETVHFSIRKLGHLTEYGILGALLFRAFRGDEKRRWHWRWSVSAVILAAIYAATDEWHQSFVPSREPSAWDALIDTVGATLAQVLFFRR